MAVAVAVLGPRRRVSRSMQTISHVVSLFPQLALHTSTPGGRGQAWPRDKPSGNVRCVNKQSLPFRGRLSSSLRSMNWSFSVFAAERNLETCHNSFHGRGFWDVRRSHFLCVPADCRLYSRSSFDWWEPEMCKNSIDSRKYKAHSRLRGWPWSLLPECKQIKTVEKLHLSTYENVYSRRSPSSFVNSVIFLYAKTIPANLTICQRCQNLNEIFRL